MEKHIITSDLADISADAFLSALHVDAESDLYEDVMALYRAARGIARPIALYAPLSPDITGGVVRLNGVAIPEPFVYKMLSGQKTVVPYAASCGKELENWSRPFTDAFERFAADTLKHLCLNAIRSKLIDTVRSRHFDPGKNISAINPGSLAEWPLTGQLRLFELLGGVTGDIGVELSESLLMLPTKSSSGIMFQTDGQYHNCSLCPRQNCPNRRVAYAG